MTRQPSRGGSGGSTGSGGSGRRPSDEPLGSEALPPSVPCPFCGGEETEQFAGFGSALSTGQYYCRSCRTVFEAMKWRTRGSEGGAGGSDEPEGGARGGSGG